MSEQGELTAQGELVQSPATEVRRIDDTSAQGMLAEAVARGMGVETIERLMALRDKMEAERARNAFFEALSAFQSEMPVIRKTKEIKTNQGKVRSRYAPLEDIVEAVKPLLVKHGFSYTLKPVQEQDGFTAHLIAHHKDGHEEETTFTVPIDNDAYMNAPQKVGSARTYALRYAFCNAFGIMTSDTDDDGKASGDIDAVLAAYEELAALSKVTTLKALAEEAKKLREKLPEGDPRREIVKQYYEQRRAEIKEAVGASD